MRKTLSETFKNAGATDEAAVRVEVSYDIVKHVSAQLYTSPRKAIEELVCNSYDAGAEECHVRIPTTANEALVVLDNGTSMDVDGLKGLWRVASSPKVDPAKPTANRVANGRMQIGRFGVGKLAAFALGTRLTHAACVRGQVRVISVGEEEIKDRKDGKPPSFKVFTLPVAKAQSLLEPLLGDLPKPWERKWQTWTIALVQDIDESAIRQSLKMGILRRMIRTALPVSTSFKVSLDGEDIPRREIDKEEIEVTVNLIDAEFKKHLERTLQEFWAEKLNEKDPKAVASTRYTVKVEKVRDPKAASMKVNALIVPGLGPCIGEAISTKTALTSDKLQERGYADNGFAVTCFGKLVNTDDPLFGVSQRSHKYWSKFLARVEMPELDSVLLVQRNAVSESSEKAQLAREVLRALFNYTRTQVEALEESDNYEPGSYGKRLTSSAPVLAQAALKGLAQGAVTAADLKKLSIDFGTLGVAGPATQFDVDAMAIIINEDHPLIDSIDELAAGSKQLRRVIGEVVAGIEMTRGYLKSRGVSDDLIAELAQIADSSLRTAAEFVMDAVEEHIKRIEQASFVGDTEFEKAIVDAFKSLRLAAQHVGGSDNPDGIIDIPRAGRDNLRISIEAKGTPEIT